MAKSRKPSKKAVKKLAEIVDDHSDQEAAKDPRAAFVRARTKVYDKAGQPTKYKPEYCEQLIEFMALGNAFEAFSTEVGTHRETLYEWAKVHPNFSDAHKKGKDLCLRFWQDVGFAGVTNQIPFFGHLTYGLIMRHLFHYEDKDNQQGKDLQTQIYEEAMAELEAEENAKLEMRALPEPKSEPDVT